MTCLAAGICTSSRLPEGFQTLLYTATWPKKVRALANEFLKNPVTVHVGDTSNQLVASKNITQIVKVVPQREKYSWLGLGVWPFLADFTAPCHARAGDGETGMPLSAMYHTQY